MALQVVRDLRAGDGKLQMDLKTRECFRFVYTVSSFAMETAILHKLYTDVVLVVVHVATGECQDFRPKVLFFKTVITTLQQSPTFNKKVK